MKKCAFILSGLFFLICNYAASSVSQTPANEIPVNRSETQEISPNQNQARTIPTPEPKLTAEKPTVGLSLCAKERVKGLAKQVNIPQELCLDDKKPIDRTEDVVVTKTLPENTWKTVSGIKFAKLPKEVRRIIRLTSEEKYAKSKFEMRIVLTDDAAKPNRSVKEYIFIPYVFDAKLKDEVWDTVSWRFKRQNKLLKLEFAEFQ